MGRWGLSCREPVKVSIPCTNLCRYQRQPTLIWVPPKRGDGHPSLTGMYGRASTDARWLAGGSSSLGARDSSRLAPGRADYSDIG